MGLIGLVVVGTLGMLYFAPARGEKQKAACVLLIDRTGSSFDPITRESYRRLAESAIEGCRRLKATLTLYYFDNTNAKLQRAGASLYRLYRPPTHREKLGEEAVAESMRRANAAVESVFQTPPDNSVNGHGSDILTAVNLAAQSLQQAARQARVSKKYLVVLTDGYQTGHEFGARSHFRSAEDSPRPLIARARGLGLVPALSDVQTSFVGVDGGLAGARSNTPAWFEASVRKFWTGLVEQGGGQMCVYGLEPIGLPGQC